MKRLYTIALATVLASAAAFTVSAAKPGGATTAAATVFLPNPVADLQDQSLTDQKDADYAALAPAYHGVTLTNLDGSGYLRGTGPSSSAKRATPRSRPPAPSTTTAIRTSSSR